jgi:hypothetical protein
MDSVITTNQVAARAWLPGRTGLCAIDGVQDGATIELVVKVGESWVARGNALAAGDEVEFSTGYENVGVRVINAGASTSIIVRIREKRGLA